MGEEIALLAESGQLVERLPFDDSVSLVDAFRRFVCVCVCVCV